MQLIQTRPYKTALPLVERRLPRSVDKAFQKFAHTEPTHYFNDFFQVPRRLTCLDHWTPLSQDLHPAFLVGLRLTEPGTRRNKKLNLHVMVLDRCLGREMVFVGFVFPLLDNPMDLHRCPKNAHVFF